jgi:hypothetical protein
MHQIAKRYLNRYSKLFKIEQQINLNKYVNVSSYFDFFSSNKNRSIDSGLNFIQGLYENNLNLFDLLSRKIVINNQMIRLFELCDRYVQEVVKNKKHSELPKFKHGAEMTQMVENFKIRNDLPSEMSIDAGIYTLKKMIS